MGDNIAGVEDSTGEYCIFSIVSGGWRKNTAVNLDNCIYRNAGYISTSSTSWTVISTWNNNPTAYWYEYKSLNGCDASKKNIIF